MIEYDPQTGKSRDIKKIEKMSDGSYKIVYRKISLRNQKQIVKYLPWALAVVTTAGMIAALVWTKKMNDKMDAVAPSVKTEQTVTNVQNQSVVNLKDTLVQKSR